MLTSRQKKTEMNFKISIVWLISLFFLNFALQNVNFITLNWNSCSYYTYNPACSSPVSFMLNKTIRLLLNTYCIYLALQLYNYSFNKKQFMITASSLVVLFIIDIAFCFASNPLLINFHKVLNPVLYSPLIPMVLLAYYFSKQLK